MYSSNLKKKKTSFFILSLYFFILLSCSKDNITEPVTILGDVFVIDTFNVNITYDETPGFKYPMMKHEIKAVTHLTERGNISGYEYVCELADIDNSASYDFIHLQKSGFKFRHNLTIWGTKMFDPNSVLPYTFTYLADLEKGYKSFTYKTSSKVIYSSTGIAPEENSVQLTGPTYWNYQPQFSKDGNWIYYKNSHSIYRTNTSGAGQQDVKILDYPAAVNIGRFNILDNNQLAFVLWQRNQYSKIVIVDLQTLTETSYEVHGYLWGTCPIRIPNTNKFLNLLNYNTLLTADIETLKVDTLLNIPKGDIMNYSINPVNNNLYVITSKGNSYDVIEYDFETHLETNFLNNAKIYELKFFPNGVDYGYIKKDDNGFENIYLNVNGVERQLTKYPGDVYGFNFSPNGDEIVFYSKRRGEVQSWEIRI